MKIILIFTCSIFSIVCISCKSSKQLSADTSNKELKALKAMMAGKYSSKEQSKRDTNYFNISLIMTPIWEDRSDGEWLYVEQAVASNLAKPYRQRVYHLQHPSRNTYTSDIYTIKDALSFAGAQSDDAKMKSLTFDKIELKEGCTVTLVKEADLYKGGTEDAKCPSDLRGAKYATTKITMKEGELISWDQGFDANGKQVWGAENGGYIFIKEK